MENRQPRTILSDLSQSRSFLMGVGILWVITFHLLPDLAILGGGRKDRILRHVFSSGYGACDVFLLLSGFGLAISLKRDGNPLRFYGRRMRKLLPAYYLFIPLFLGLLYVRGQLTTEILLGNLTFTGFWRSVPYQFNWYVQVIMLFYLVSPGLHWFFEHCKSRTVAILVLLAASALLILKFFGTLRMIAITRVPVFVLGFWVGRHEKQEWPWRIWHPVAAVAACAVGTVLQFWTQPYITDWNGLFWYPFLLIAPGLCLLGAWIRPLLLKIPGYSYLDKMVCLFGACSFEIYLIQSLLIEWIHPPLSGRLQWYLLGAAAIGLGIGYHYLLQWGLRALASRKTG